MKHILTILLSISILISCQEETQKSSLETLRSEKSNLITKIDSLNDILRGIEQKISKLDTSKKLQIVTTIPVKNDVFKHFIEIQGVVQTDKNIQLRPELGGIVEYIAVKEGQSVGKGALLMQLEDSMLKNRMRELTTQLALAQTIYQRQENLWNQKIGSELQYLQAKSTKEGLENKLASLKTQIAKMKIIAPFAGIVDEIIPRKGELTSPQSPVIRLINLDNVYVEADVTEIYLPFIKVGTETLLDFVSINKQVSSEISQIGNYINPNNRSFKAKIKLSNKDHQIKPNLLADLKVMDFKAEGIIVPSNLIQKDQSGRHYIFTINNDNGENKVVKNIITIEKEYNQETFISEGLNKNDRIVNQGARLVKAGDIVRIDEI